MNLSYKKAKMGKTRVFTGAPFDWSIVVRKYCLGFTRLLQNNRIIFESGPGTIAQSLEWQELYDFITKFGNDSIVAGDYKSFDKTMSPIEVLGAFDVIKKIMQVSGNYDEEDLLIVQGIAEDTAFALVDYNGDLVQLYGSNPSGNPLTVIINSIVNCIRMRYVYYTLNPQNEVDSFNTNVSLMTYGDDNIMGISKTVPWYNHTSISNAFSSLGITYTMPDKESESVPYINIACSTFLKRSWRFDHDLDCHLAPLDHESIEKMLMVWNRSKSIPEEAQCIAVISTALREYFFYGRDVFEEKRKLLIKLVSDMGITNWVEDATFPTYTQLYDSFISASKHCTIFDKYFNKSDLKESTLKITLA
jgi:uncharacterized membrane protein YbaN (DUF454 family)